MKTVRWFWLVMLVLACCAPRPDHTLVPGVIIDYSPARSGRYIGSPGIAVLPNGTYVASHDFFGPKSNKNRTRIFRSTDRGESWDMLTDIVGQWWSTLFVHKGDLYIMGVSEAEGNAVIRRSSDGGATWTEPVDANSGLLLADGGYHCAPVPVLIHNGRIWRAMEDIRGGDGWGEHFRTFMMSAPVDADLLNASNWTVSNRIARDSTWLDGRFNGWLEGNAVATPEGEVVNILRVDYDPGGIAAMIHINKDGNRATFDPKQDFIDFPGGAKKFTIRYDSLSQRYWSLVNIVRPPSLSDTVRAASIRNTQVLINSPDLRHWDVKSTILSHPDIQRHGFQYVDWLFDGDDIIAVSRTAYDDGVGGAHNFHDANYMTFHRIQDFRKQLPHASPVK